MDDDLKALLARRAALDVEIDAARNGARMDAIQRVRAMMEIFGLTVNDLAPRSRKGPKVGAKIAAKYRDPESGATWSGRGLRPKWLVAKIAAGNSLKDFAL